MSRTNFRARKREIEDIVNFDKYQQQVANTNQNNMF